MTWPCSFCLHYSVGEMSKKCYMFVLYTTTYLRSLVGDWRRGVHLRGAAPHVWVQPLYLLPPRHAASLTRSESFQPPESLLRAEETTYGFPGSQKTLQGPPSSPLLTKNWRKWSAYLRSEWQWGTFAAPPHLEPGDICPPLPP